MYKVTTKFGTFLFFTLEDAFTWIDTRSERIFEKSAFVKIKFEEDAAK